MTDLERRLAWEAQLTDEEIWRAESGGRPLLMPVDWTPETDSEEEERHGSAT